MILVHIRKHCPQLGLFSDYEREPTRFVMASLQREENGSHFCCEKVNISFQFSWIGKIGVRCILWIVKYSWISITTHFVLSYHLVFSIVVELFSVFIELQHIFIKFKGYLFHNLIIAEAHTSRHLLLQYISRIVHFYMQEPNQSCGGVGRNSDQTPHTPCLCEKTLMYTCEYGESYLTYVCDTPCGVLETLLS